MIWLVYFTETDAPVWVDLTIHHRAINRIVYKVVGPSQVIDTQVGRVGRVGSPARPSSADRPDTSVRSEA